MSTKLNKDPYSLDDFPIQVGNAVMYLTKIGTSDSLIEKVLEEVIGNELMYRFSNEDVTPAAKLKMVLLLQYWSGVVREISGRDFAVEDFVINE